MSVRFISKARLFSSLVSCRTSMRNQWSSSGSIVGSATTPAVHVTQKTYKSLPTNHNHVKQSTAPTQTTKYQSSSSSSSSRKGMAINHKTMRISSCRNSWRWTAVAGWTILSFLDWWLKAAGGWFTLRGVFLKWTPIGICIVAAVQWQWQFQANKNEQQLQQRKATEWQANVYCSLPLRLLSRGWGWLADCRIPVPIRPLVYGCYSAAFGVNVQEASSSDFKHYRSLAEFFTRSLKDDVRKVDFTSCLTSPADGRVLHFGAASNGRVEQVKGVTYSLQSFLGQTVENTSNEHKLRLSNAADDTEIYQCIIYLAPGDYHRFHSPAAWQPKLRRHFVGELLSVSPLVAHWLPGLFCLNERVAYVGCWQHGFFSFTAVGATNVGSVQIYMDEALHTNRWTGWNFWGAQNPDGLYAEKQLPPDTRLSKGELIGQFNMGSTVVLVFEAPKGFRFTLEPGQTIRMGEPLGCIN